MKKALPWIVLALVALGALGTWLVAELRPPVVPAAAPVVVSPEVLVRAHSPVIGPADAPVTIVEFLDPACEACKASHPHVKSILAAHPGRVKLVVRYAPFHKGADIAVGILEMARLQGKFEPVLEALYARQADWARHGAPDLPQAWRIAQGAGLDISETRQREALPSVQRVLQQDVADTNTLRVEGTPMFYVNGTPLDAAGAQGLQDRVAQAVARAAAPR